jgi:hypothetical protein
VRALEELYSYEATITRTRPNGEVETWTERKRRPFLELVGSLDPNSVEITLLSDIVWAALIKEDENLEPENVRKMLDDIENAKQLTYIIGQLDRAVFEFYNDSDLTYEDSKKKAAEIIGEVDRPKNFNTIGGNSETSDADSLG